VIDKSLSIEALTGEEIKIITERLFSSSIQHFMEYSKSKIQSAFPLYLPYEFQEMFCRFGRLVLQKNDCEIIEQYFPPLLPFYALIIKTSISFLLSDDREREYHCDHDITLKDNRSLLAEILHIYTLYVYNSKCSMSVVKNIIDHFQNPSIIPAFMTKPEYIPIRWIFVKFIDKIASRVMSPCSSCSSEEHSFCREMFVCNDVLIKTIVHISKDLSKDIAHDRSCPIVGDIISYLSRQCGYLSQQCEYLPSNQKRDMFGYIGKDARSIADWISSLKKWQSDDPIIQRRNEMSFMFFEFILASKERSTEIVRDMITKFDLESFLKNYLIEIISHEKNDKS
ncbi:hypothetical protein ADUPG1_001324, partial [Aduncisulcus paluster]